MHRNQQDKLIDPSDVTHMFKITKVIGLCATGKGRELPSPPKSNHTPVPFHRPPKFFALFSTSRLFVTPIATVKKRRKLGTSTTLIKRKMQRRTRTPHTQPAAHARRLALAFSNPCIVIKNALNDKACLVLMTRRSHACTALTLPSSSLYPAPPPPPHKRVK